MFFFHAVLPTFTRANKFLQTTEPLIHTLLPQLTNLLKSILGKFVRPSIIPDSLKAARLFSLDFTDPGNHLNDENLFVGFLTRQTVSRLLENGHISDRQATTFFTACRDFFVCARAYILKWCPFQDELLKHATWLDFTLRQDKGFNSVESFVHRVSHVFSAMDIDLLHEQFLDYQLLMPKHIPKTVKEAAGLQDENLLHVAVFWGYLRGVNKPGTNSNNFDLLLKVAEAVMTRPHSNAVEERIVSLINTNKTPTRSSLTADGTLSSLIVVKAQIDNPLEWRPSATLIDKAKRATTTYNDKHKS